MITCTMHNIEEHQCMSTLLILSINQHAIKKKKFVRKTFLVDFIQFTHTKQIYNPDWDMYRRSLIFLYFALQYAPPLWCTQFYNIYITTYSILLAVFKIYFSIFLFFFLFFPCISCKSFVHIYTCIYHKSQCMYRHL